MGEMYMILDRVAAQIVEEMRQRWIVEEKRKQQQVNEFLKTKSTGDT